MLPFWPAVWMFLGAMSGGVAVAMSAVAAHALPSRLPPKGLAAVANGAGFAFAIGSVLFCGSIYAGEMAGLRIGPTAPLGGVLLMVGWVMLAVSALLASRPWV